jgi:hypothetical protein
MWRPNGWKISDDQYERINKNSKDIIGTLMFYASGRSSAAETADVLDKRTTAAFEAGADAMLEALRARGYHVDRDAVFCSRGERQTLYNVGNTGIYTFIPDEGAQQ